MFYFAFFTKGNNVPTGCFFSVKDDVLQKGISSYRRKNFIFVDFMDPSQSEKSPRALCEVCERFASVYSAIKSSWLLVQQVYRRSINAISARS